MTVFKSKTALIVSSITGIVAVLLLCVYFSRRSTYFDFAKGAYLAEISIDGATVLKSGQNELTKSWAGNEPPELKALLPEKSGDLRQLIYRQERRKIFFRKKRVILLNVDKAALRYYLKIPPGAKLEYAFTAEGTSPTKQAVSQMVEVESLDGRRLKLDDTLPLEESGQFAVRKFYQLDLAPLVDQICKITFSLHPNGTPPEDVQMGWLDPLLTVPSNRQESRENPDREAGEKLEKVRALNQKSNLIIFLLDASNAKHLGTYGYPRNTTPTIDTLGREGAVFENAFCQSVYTLSSTGDLFTSTTSLIHGVVSKESQLSKDFVTLPETLQKNGFKTAGFVASPNASSTFGYEQGFDQMFELFRVKGGKALQAGKFLSPVSEWLEQNRQKRFFLYVHFREPHLPLIEPDPFGKMFDPDYSGHLVGTFPVITKINSGELKADPRDIEHLIALYDGNLAYVDSVVGQILAKLKQLSLYDDTVVLVLSDHGEALWEHGYEGHNIYLYEENIRIPLIFRFSRRDVPVRSRVDQLVRTIDVYPTLLDLFGIEESSNPYAQGKSFLPYLFSNSDDPDTEVISHTTDRLDFSLRTNRYKYIWSSDESEALYDLQSDSKETKNILAEQPILAGYLRLQIKKFVPEQQEKLRKFAIHEAEAPTIDQDTDEKLKALGYVN